MTKDQIISKLVAAGMDKYIARQAAGFGTEDGFAVADMDLSRCDRKKIKQLVQECGAVTDKGIWFKII
jgi:hypothetical protein